MTFLLRRIPGTSRSALLYGISLLISDLHHLRKHLVATQRLALRWKWAYRWLSFVRLSSPKKKSSLMLQQGICVDFPSFNHPSHHSAPSLHPKCTCRPYVSGECDVVCEEWQWQSQSNDKIQESQNVHSHFLSSEAQTAKSLKKSLRKLCRSDIFEKKMWPRHGLD